MFMQFYCRLEALTEDHFASAIAVHIKNVLLSTLLLELEEQYIQYLSITFFILFNTIETIICFNIPHFHLLLSCLVISFRNIQK